jgi:hypothetical protein
MREEQQRKTTAAAEALFSPARLALRRALLPAIVSETNFILGVQVDARIHTHTHTHPPSHPLSPSVSSHMD